MRQVYKTSAEDSSHPFVELSSSASQNYGKPVLEIELNTSII